MKKTVSNLGEFGLIDWIKKACVCGPTVKQGIGDDAAVLPYSKKEDLLMTTDMFIEGVHFTPKTKPELVGRKALACNVSDIAAMGGTPTFAVVSLAIPPKTKDSYVKKIYHGMSQLGKEFGINIVGGDTVKDDKVVIDVTLLGKVAKNKAVLRSGAKSGDQIFVTGPLGGSLKSDRHLTFTPRVKEAEELTKKFKLTSMIDISDGLGADLGHILEQSKVGAVLFEQFIPRNKNVSLDQALYDGEDFELLFTLPRREATRIAKNKRFHHIGEISGKEPKLFLVNENHQREEVPLKGFTHF